MCELNEPERVVIVDLVDRELEGISDARESTIEDRSITTPEQLNYLMSGYDDSIQTLRSIREKLS